jgi:hypothetical protein
MTVRRASRAEARAEFWVEQIAGTPDGNQALTFAWNWVRKELAVVAEQRPEAAEAARWDLARQLGAYASRLRRARIVLRAGLEPAERWRLLNPWKRGGGPQ